jgi:hypothetical protein
MKLYLFIAVFILTIYLVMYKYRFKQTKEVIREENKELRKKDNHSFQGPNHSILVTLNNIQASDKVTLDEVSEKWSLTKDTIDPLLNKKIVTFIRESLNTLGLFPLQDYYIHTIENIYMMKDSNTNFRMVGDAFVQDIRSFFTFRILFDFVSINDNVYINYVDIDESSVNTLMDRYNIRWKSQGILNNFNSFDKGVMSLLDNHYETNTTLFKANKDTRDEEFDRTTRITQFYSASNRPSVEFPMFCKKHTKEWDLTGNYLQTINDCMFHNPYTIKYPNDPYFAPGVITKRTDVNNYNWLYKPERGNHLRN